VIPAGPLAGTGERKDSMPGRLMRIPDHSNTLRRMTPSEASLSVVSSYTYLHELGPRSENPVLFS